MCNTHSLCVTASPALGVAGGWCWSQSLLSLSEGWLRPGQVGSLSQGHVGRHTTVHHTSEHFRVTICLPSPCLCIEGES